MTYQPVTKIIDTPRGYISQTDAGSVELVWNKDFDDRWDKKFSTVQRKIDSEVLRLCAPRVPFDKGILNKSGILGTVIGSGEVKYIAPYAAKMYYNPQFNFQGAPMRGAFWFERMKAEDRDYIKKVAGRDFK